MMTRLKNEVSENAPGAKSCGVRPRTDCTTYVVFDPGASAQRARLEELRRKSESSNAHNGDGWIRSIFDMN